MPRLVITTVGTSLLTNQIDRGFEDNWATRLLDTANCTDAEIEKHHEDVTDIIADLKVRAEEKLQGDVDDIREASAELNGIYGLYEDNLEEGKEDIHLLIATDTKQGRLTAEIIEKFLKSQGLRNISTYYPPGFSLASTNIFLEGMADLFYFLQDTIYAAKKEQYTICFNLVGSFKAVQGYLNTIGMFYADEIVYVFEGSNEVIKIPRLPVDINKSKVEPHKVQLAMMSQGDILASWDKAKIIPQDWVLVDGNEMTLSTWGNLIWSQCKEEFLSGKLLSFPNINYESSFEKDYGNIKDIKEKLQLQETLAKVSCLLMKHDNDTTPLKEDGGLQYEVYKKSDRKQVEGLAHFRVTQALRVSCVKVKDALLLRHYSQDLHRPDNA